MDVAIPMVQALLPSIRGEAGVAQFSERFVDMVKALRHRPVDMMRDLLGPYDALLKRWLRSDLTRGPVSALPLTPAWGRMSPEGRSSLSGRRPTTSLANGMPEADPVPPHRCTRPSPELLRRSSSLCGTGRPDRRFGREDPHRCPRRRGGDRDRGRDHGDRPEGGPAGTARPCLTTRLPQCRRHIASLQTLQTSVSRAKPPPTPPTALTT